MLEAVERINGRGMENSDDTGTITSLRYTIQKQFEMDQR